MTSGQIVSALVCLNMCGTALSQSAPPATPRQAATRPATLHDPVNYNGRVVTDAWLDHKGVRKNCLDSQGGSGVLRQWDALHESPSRAQYITC